MPKISVIVPAYNAASTIEQTIASVEAQTFDDWEMIVIDDGSCDRTCEIVNSMTNPRIVLFSYPHAGVSVARNRGYAHAQGEYVTFLDADDLWSADKLQLQLVALQQHPHAGVAYSWTRFLDAEGSCYYPAQPVWWQGDVYPHLLVRNFLYCGSNALIRRSAIELVGGFDPNLTHGEDWEFFVRLAARVDFVVVPKSQILYRQTHGSASSQVALMEQSTLRVIDAVFDAVPLHLRSLKFQNLAYLYQFIAQLYLQRDSSTEGVRQAKQKLQKSVFLYPQILLNRKTQTLMIKLLLFRLFSTKVAFQFMHFISKLHAKAVVFNLQ